MRLASWIVCLQLLAAACAGDAHAPIDKPSQPTDVELDSDADGLCDATEAQIGTNAMSADTDADGLPDAQEWIAGTDPRNRSDPARDHVAYYDGTSASFEFEVALAVTGEGQAMQGEFNARPTLDPSERRASDFYRGCVAVAADPSDHVRNADAKSFRFGLVLGKTQLRYRLAFGPQTDPARDNDCASTLPFDVVTRDDAGHELAGDSYALIVGAADASVPADQFCRPAACL